MISKKAVSQSTMSIRNPLQGGGNSRNKRKNHVLSLKLIGMVMIITIIVLFVISFSAVVNHHDANNHVVTSSVVANNNNNNNNNNKPFLPGKQQKPLRQNKKELITKKMHDDSDKSNTNKEVDEVSLRQMKQVDDDNNNKKSQQQQKSDRVVSNFKDVSAILKKIRSEFVTRYGGESLSSELYKNAIQSYGSIDVTANRIVNAVLSSENNEQSSSSFIMSFAGYSVTVGRGNYFNESYPFVMERILKDAMTTIGIDNFIVRNSAIGGIPSFPYGFCMEHFLGNDADVISWDYSMNEGKGASILEAYLRQSLSQLNKQPMFIMLDTKDVRCDILKSYTNKQNNILQDAISIGRAESILKGHLDIIKNETPESDQFIGFQQWDDFGAPDGCPGRSSWHPKKKEHELIGWMIAMHFVNALEIANDKLKKATSGTVIEQRKLLLNNLELQPKSNFPPQIAPVPPNNNKAVTTMLFGHPTTKNDGQVKMNNISCRTNFLPAVDNDKVLPNIIVSGYNTKANADSIMDERSDEMYNTGWVLDVSKTERDTKVKVQKCGGLGYIDMKIALYGIPESGTLTLWLPHESRNGGGSSSSSSNNAKDYFDELVICEANEKRTKQSCQLDKDVEYIVGGVTMDNNIAPSMIEGAGAYLKRSTCAHIGIPSNAKVTLYKDVSNEIEQNDKQSESIRSPNDIGLLVQIKAKSNVTRKNGACCVSHVVWEQH